MSKNFQAGVSLFLNRDFYPRILRVEKALITICLKIGKQESIGFVKSSTTRISEDDTTIIYLESISNQISKMNKQNAINYLKDICKECGPRTCGGSNQSMSKLKSVLKVLSR